MFQKVTMVVYLLCGGFVGNTVASLIGTGSTGATLSYIAAGAAISVSIYAILRFAHFAERAYRREMAVTPQTVFADGKVPADEIARNWEKEQKS